ncbi:hypothetical protein PS710_01599 [Pseudomonas fluorescens]|uniref:Uncharacterized protein n=1 Tax=Pseudomonas fluorescens TaxID=294 RepID=A0A5E7BRN9_PSEFL|nr:hypothetical protein PS710_01599 [Pseudomonas fluorescens]
MSRPEESVRFWLWIQPVDATQLNSGNPPDTDPVSPYEPDSNTLNEAAERTLDFHSPSTADIKATPRTPCTQYRNQPRLNRTIKHL